MSAPAPPQRPSAESLEPYPHAVAALAAVAKKVNAARGLDDVLSHAVRTTRRLLGADRATVLLLDDTGSLRPAVAAAHTSDESLYSQFRAMSPIRVQLNSAQRHVLSEGRAVAIDDARNSPVVPEEWRETFALQSLALVPLATGGRPYGVLVVDSESARPFGQNELAALEGIAASTSTAVHAARELESATARAERLSRTLAITTALNATPHVDEVLTLAVECFLDIFQTESCSISVLDVDRTSFTTLIARGGLQPSLGRHQLAEVSPLHLDELRAQWARDPDAPFVYGADALRHSHVTAPARGVLLPLCQERRVRGFALVEVPASLPLAPELLELAMSVAGQVWLALDRARLASDLAHRLSQAELMRRLSETLAATPEMAVAVELLAPAIRDVTAGELLAVLLLDAPSARAFKAGRPMRAERARMRSWTGTGTDRPAEVDGVVLVPMVLEGVVVGALRLRPGSAAGLREDNDALLLTLATGVAEVVARAVLRERAARKDRDLAVAQERDRLTHDLHRSVERQLGSAAKTLHVASRQPAPPPLRRALEAALALVSSARGEVNEAVSSLGTLRRTDRGIVALARELGSTLASSTGATVEVKIVGSPRALPPATEGILLRVLHEILTSVERHARASTVLVSLRFGEADVQISVRDNGVGLALRTGPEGGVLTALRTIQQRLTAVGGSLTFEGDGTRGVRVDALVPVQP